MIGKLSVCIVLVLLLVLKTVGAEAPTLPRILRVRLTVETLLAHLNTPLDPAIDFPELIRQSGTLAQVPQ